MLKKYRNNERKLSKICNWLKQLDFRYQSSWPDQKCYIKQDFLQHSQENIFPPRFTLNLIFTVSGMLLFFTLMNIEWLCCAIYMSTSLHLLSQVPFLYFHIKLLNSLNSLY